MTNSRTEILLSTFKPVIGLMVYASNLKEYYIESHDINEQGQLLEGKPLKQETLQGMVDVFFDERKNRAKFKGMLPANLIAFDLLPGGNYQMIWHRPAEIRVIHFAEQLKIPTGEAWVPAMTYKVESNRLQVFALSSNTRPKLASKLYRAPFHNVSDNGDVCLGSARVSKPKELTYEAMQKYWEDLFWLSEFTHLNGSNKPVKTDLGKVWKKLIASKKKIKWSDLNELKAYQSLTLKSLMK